MKRAEEMRAVFARHEESGLSLKAFGEREGISYTTLQYWRRKFSGRKDGKGALPAASVALAPVRIVSDPAPVAPRAERFEVWFSNGVSLEVPSGFDELELRSLVGVLSAC
jgi:hypothetical protein